MLVIVALWLTLKVGKQTSKVQDILRPIGGRILFAHTHRITVGSQLNHVDGEQLRDLAREVLVGEETVEVDDELPVRMAAQQRKP